MKVTVPNLIGLDRAAAEAALGNLSLRYIAKFPVSAGGNGTATEQSPPAGTKVGRYTVVTVAYPSPLGGMPDSPVGGPIPPVIVPNLVGLGRVTAEAVLDSLMLRYIAKFPVSAGGDGTATQQSPAAGTTAK